LSLFFRQQRTHHYRTFLCLTTHEQRLLKRLKVIAASTKPPEVAINGFDHFEKHTIFLTLQAPGR
jgi:plasmid maintenance system killer protein